jgi:predicted CopG family antitoxin
VTFYADTSWWLPSKTPVTRTTRSVALLFSSLFTNFLFASCSRSCMHESMKTITLDDTAYSRLKSWKRSSNESFSSVVKRVLPEPATLGAFLNFVETHQTRSLPSNAVFEEAVNDHSSVKQDPWI